MKKNCSLLAAALLTGTFVLSSCSSDELPVGNEVQQLATESAMTYSFSVPAVMGDEADTRVFNIGESSIESKFSSSERVYVFMKNDGYLIYANKYLTPTNLQDGDKKCTLAIDGLSFLINTEFQGITEYAPQPGDVVYFYYGMRLESTNEEPYYNFWTDGSSTIERMKDYSLAKMKVKSNNGGTLTFCQEEDETKEYFTFKNINSIFRQKLTFKDRNGNEVTPTIKEITINISGGYELSQYYYPFSSKTYGTAPIKIQNPKLTDGNIYFSVIFNELNKNGDVSFIAKDINDNTYYTSKGSPSTGFENNKYYYGNATLEQGLLSLANINVPIVIEKNNDGGYIGRIEKEEGKDLDITMSGSSENMLYAFTGSGNYNITLDGLKSSNSGNTNFMGFGGGSDPDTTVTLNLKGNNEIKIDNEYAVFMYGIVGSRTCNLKLKCEGDIATITFMRKTTSSDVPSFRDFSNIPNKLIKNIPLSEERLKSIAVEGYEVECTAETSGGYDKITFTVKNIQ